MDRRPLRSPHAGNRYPRRPQSRRRILCVFPRYAPSFGTFQHAYALVPRVKAFMPPQGLLLITAYLPAQWEVRFVDENVRPARDADYAWADAVLMSGMHVQRQGIADINDAAHRHGTLTAVGGPSVSSCPGYYPDVDLLHVGELGDATDALIARLDASVQRSASQERFDTVHRLPLDEFPIPAYELLDMSRYFIASIQFSSGCPYQCEFCDIPALYGRRPRLKSADQIGAELDAIVAAGGTGGVYFVDDNFIGNRRAARDLLPYLVQWQRSHGYPVEFACEATLNLAQQTKLLEMMREANFTTVFCGIETPEPEALRAMQKQHNLRQPLVESVHKLNSFGIEIVAGIIMGLDTDSSATPESILAFIRESSIPMLTINLLYALPQTPLYERLQAAGRLDSDPRRVSNVVFRMPDEQVGAMWSRCVAQAYDPANLYRRFAYQTEATFPNRLWPHRDVRAHQVAFGMRILARVLWQVGYRADYRSAFWELAGPLLRQGRIEEVIHIGLVGHHLIRFARDALEGRGEACFYADPTQGAHPTV